MPHTWGPKAGKQFKREAREAAPSPEGRPAGPPRKARVLFVCLGNSCRSQMAEAFARHYGHDVLEAHSAGLAPAPLVAPLTRRAMLEAKGIDLSGQWPKSVFEAGTSFDLIVNISGNPLPPMITAPQVRTWTVADPVAGDQALHLKVANQIETLVQQLILNIRQGKNS